MRNRPLSFEQLEDRSVPSATPLSLQEEWRSFLGTSAVEAPTSPVAWAQTHKPGNLQAPDAHIPTVSVQAGNWGVHMRYTDLPPGLEADLDIVNKYGQRQHREVSVPAGLGDLNIEFAPQEMAQIILSIDDIITNQRLMTTRAFSFGAVDSPPDVVAQHQELVDLAFSMPNDPVDRFIREKAHQPKSTNDGWEPFLPDQLVLTTNLESPVIWSNFRETGMYLTGLSLTDDPRNYAKARYPQYFGATAKDDLLVLQNMAYKDSRGVTREMNRLLMNYQATHDQLIKDAYQAIIWRNEAVSYTLLSAYNSILFRRLKMPVNDVVSDINNTMARNPRYGDASRFVPFPTADEILAAVDKHFASMYFYQRKLSADQQAIYDRNNTITHGTLSTETPATTGRMQQHTQMLIANTLATSNDPRIEGVRVALGPQTVEAIINGTAQTTLVAPVTPVTAPVNVVLASTPTQTVTIEPAKEKTKEEYFAEALSWFNPNASILKYFPSLRSDTVMGQIAIGFMDKTEILHDMKKRMRYALAMESVTGIPRSTFLDAPQSNQGKLLNYLGDLWTKLQYPPLIKSKNDTLSFRAQAEKAKYVSDEVVRFSVDAATGGKAIASIELHPDLPVGPEYFLLGQSEGQTYVTVSVATLQEHNLTGSIILKAKITLSDGTVIEKQTGSVGIAKPTKPNLVAPKAPETLPEPNRILVNYLRTTVLPTLQKVSETEYKSADIGAGGECKIWVQKTAVPSAFVGTTAPVIPSNSPDIKAEWKESDDIIVAGKFAQRDMRSLEAVQKFFQNTAIAGDMIQMEVQTGTKTIPHTLIIDSVTKEGIWVFDSNWSMDFDHTVRYHFMAYDSLTNKINETTIYRIKP